MFSARLIMPNSELLTDYSIPTIHPWKIFIISTYQPCSLDFIHQSCDIRFPWCWIFNIFFLQTTVQTPVAWSCLPLNAWTGYTSWLLQTGFLLSGYRTLTGFTCCLHKTGFLLSMWHTLTSTTGQFVHTAFLLTTDGFVGKSFQPRSVRFRSGLFWFRPRLFWGRWHWVSWSRLRELFGILPCFSNIWNREKQRTKQYRWKILNWKKPM